MTAIRSILFFTLGLFFFLQGCESTSTTTPAKETSKESTEKVFTAGDDQEILQDDDLFLEASLLDRSKTFKSYLWKENDTILANTRTFNPKGLSVGTHTLTLQAEDESGKIYTDTITVTIKADDINNTRPTAESFTLSLKEDTNIQTYLRGGDSDGDSLHYVIVGYPKHGTFSGSYARLIYTPDANYFGEDYFSFKTNDGKIDSKLATVTIMIEAVNDAPVWHVHPLTKIDENTNYYHEFNVTDVDGDPITITASDNMPSWLTLEANGTLHGTPTQEDIQSSFPTITFTASDGHGGESTNAFAIRVIHTNHTPIAMDDFNQTDEDHSITFNLLHNDTDIDQNHTLRLINIHPEEGNFTYTPDGNLTFLPMGDFDYLVQDQEHNVTLTYTMQDEHNSTAQADVTITIIGLDDLATIDPITIHDSNLSEANGTVTGTITAHDVDGDISYVDTNNSNGFTIDATSGAYTFTPPIGHYDYLAKGETTTLTFPIMIGDLEQNISIKIIGKNDIPIAYDDFNITTEDHSITFNILDNDIDIDQNHTLRLINIHPTEGNFTYTPEGNLTFLPIGDFDYLLQDQEHNVTLTYTMQDEYNSIAQADVTITVVGSADPATIKTINYINIDEDMPTGSAQIVMHNPEERPLTFDSNNTLLNIDNNGTYTFTPSNHYDYLPEGQTETIPVMITIFDGQNTINQEINVTINGINTPPTIEIGDDYNITAGEEISFGIQSEGDVDGEIAQYQWTLNNNSISAEANFQYTFSTPGEYHISLTVTDDKNATAIDSLIVIVNPNTTGFTKHQIFTNINEPILWLELVDLDKDEDLDILTTTANTLFWYENRGNNIYTQHLVKSGIQAQTVHAADIDGDGYQDILYAKDATEICFNEANKTFNCDRTITTTKDSLYAGGNKSDDISFISTADIDGDHTVDVISASRHYGRVDLYPQNNSEQFPLEPTIIATSMTNIISTDVADFNGDGDIDIVSAYQDGITYQENQGNGTFEAKKDIPNMPNPTSVSQADINKIGNLDIIVTLENKIRWSTTKKILWYTQDTIDENIQHPPFASGADMDSDGDIDVVSNSYEENGQIVWYENQGNGESPDFTKKIVSNDESNITITQAGDMDHDGNVDLVSADAFGHIFIFQNNKPTTSLNIAPTSNGSFSRDDEAKTVFDNTTKLTWRDDAHVITGENWDDAVSYCQNLTGNWRLPTTEELITITDKSGIQPAINSIFTNTIDDPTSTNFYWTSTLAQADTNKRWVIDFGVGSDSQHATKTQNLFTRCVSGDPLVHIFIRDDNKQVVLDKQYQLMWQDANIIQDSWINAPSVCENLSFAEFEDWRLPNINELYTIADRSKSLEDVAIKDAFSFKKASSFWAEDEEVSASMGYTIDFTEGSDAMQSETDNNYIRCVRHIQ